MGDQDEIWQRAIADYIVGSSYIGIEQWVSDSYFKGEPYQLRKKEPECIDTSPPLPF